VSFPIQIIAQGETADCRCTEPSCGFRDISRGHAQVLASLGHAAEHSLTTGHQVNEHIERDSVVLKTA
jgi:hypothetical protein